MAILQRQGMLCSVYRHIIWLVRKQQAGVLNSSRREDLTPDLLLRSAKGGGGSDMESSLTRNT